MPRPHDRALPPAIESAPVTPTPPQPASDEAAGGIRAWTERSSLVVCATHPLGLLDALALDFADATWVEADDPLDWLGPRDTLVLDANKSPMVWFEAARRALQASSDVASVILVMGGATTQGDEVGAGRPEHVVNGLGLPVKAGGIVAVGDTLGLRLDPDVDATTSHDQIQEYLSLLQAAIRLARDVQDPVDWLPDVAQEEEKARLHEVTAGLTSTNEDLSRQLEQLAGSRALAIGRTYRTLRAALASNERAIDFRRLQLKTAGSLRARVAPLVAPIRTRLVRHRALVGLAAAAGIGGVGLLRWGDPDDPATWAAIDSAIGMGVALVLLAQRHTIRANAGHYRQLHGELARTIERLDSLAMAALASDADLGGQLERLASRVEPAARNGHAAEA